MPYEINVTTAQYPRPTRIGPTGNPVRVSPPRVHTIGAAAAMARDAPTTVTPAHGIRPVVSDATAPLSEVPAIINTIMDRQDALAVAAGGRRRTWRPRRAARRPATVREVAMRRAAREARHARHMDAVETVRAYVGALCLIALFLLVIGMATVCFGILAGWWAWAPTYVK